MSPTAFTVGIHELGTNGRMAYLGLSYRAADMTRAETDAHQGIRYAASYFRVAPDRLCAQIIDRHGHHRATINGTAAAA